MVCAICHWWRVSPETPTEDDVPTFGRCIARPPSPAIFAVADVDDAGSREVVGLVQTLPTAGKESFNLVVLRSPEVLNIIEGLGYIVEMTME